MQSQITSEKSKVNEMDAVELADYAGRLSIKIDEGTITDEELKLYNLAKANYKNITGVRLTDATMNRK